MYKCKYFKIKELVCKHCLAKYSESQLWTFLDDRYKETIDVIREILGVSMVCNYEDNTQRGARCNKCDLVKSKTGPYVSAHVLWKAGDFTVEGMTAQQAREKIIANQDKLPYPIRLEDGVSWLHVDVYEVEGYKVYLFKA